MMNPQWPTYMLEDCMEAIIDYRGKTPKKTTFGIPLITAKIIKKGTILPVEEYISPDDYNEWMRRGLPKQGDVVLTTEAPLGEVAQLQNSKVALAQRVVTLRGKNGFLDNTFLKYLLLDNSVQNLLKSKSTGTTVTGIKQRELRKIKLSFPPFSEQQAIAHILGTLDDKLELNRRQNATLEAVAQAIFKEWFVDFGPVRAKMEGRQPEGMSREIADLFPDRLDDEGKPEGWEWAVLSDCCEINPKRVLQKNKYASYLDMSNMPTTNALPHKWNMRNFTSGMKFMNGDTLIARITPCLENGKTAFVDFLKNGEVGWGSTEYIVLRPKANISPFWGYLLSKTDEFRKFAIQSMTGTSGRQRVQVDQLAGFQIVKAPDTIHNIVKMQFDSIVRKLSKNRNEANILIDIRDTLLPKLISGELRVPDAEKMVADIV